MWGVGSRAQTPPRTAAAAPSTEKKNRGYSKVRTRTALGSYSRPVPRSVGSPWGRCVSLISRNPCTKAMRNETKVKDEKRDRG